MTTPTLNGQIIGQAERSTRAVLERLLADTGTDFTGWVTLNLLHTTGSTPDEATITGRVAAGLKITDRTAREALGRLAADGLVSTHDGQVTPTEAGTQRYQRIAAGIAHITERLYGGLPAADLATAGRVLVALTERADAELA
jgi:hypothetical protein